jgi:hypothetical protein
MLRKALMRRSEGRRSRHEELVKNNFQIMQSQIIDRENVPLDPQRTKLHHNFLMLHMTFSIFFSYFTHRI